MSYYLPFRHPGIIQRRSNEVLPRFFGIVSFESNNKFWKIFNNSMKCTWSAKNESIRHIRYKPFDMAGLLESVSKEWAISDWVTIERDIIHKQENRIRIFLHTGVKVRYWVREKQKSIMFLRRWEPPFATQYWFEKYKKMIQFDRINWNRLWKRKFIIRKSVVRIIFFFHF